MSNELVVQSDAELIETLKSSIYPDASDASVRLVLAYCKALKVDPMSRVVHIVPMGGKDVLIPGITLHRVMAHRSGSYMGMSDPEFGPSVTGLVGKTKMTYPSWCKIVVRRLVNGHVAEFASVEYWLENYAKINDKVSPNKIWYERPYGQLAKVCESQALRKAFPESVSSTISLEEIHHLEETPAVIYQNNAQISVSNTADEIKNKFITLTDDDKVDTSTGEVIESPEHKAELVEELRLLLQSKGIPAETYNQWKEDACVKSFTELTIAALQVIIENIKNGVL